MEYNKAKELVNETLSKATSILDIRFVEPRFLKLESDVACYVDRYHYLVKYNKEWLENASELDIIITTYRKVRHAYQQVQIEFREKLVNEDIDVEPSELVEAWKEEFQYYNIPTIEEELSSDFLSQKCEIDAYAFAYVMCLTQNGFKLDIPEVIEDVVNERIEEIIKQLGF